MKYRKISFRTILLLLLVYLLRAAADMPNEELKCGELRSDIVIKYGEINYYSVQIPENIDANTDLVIRAEPDIEKSQFTDPDIFIVHYVTFPC